MTDFSKVIPAALFHRVMILVVAACLALPAVPALSMAAEGDAATPAAVAEQTPAPAAAPEPARVADSSADRLSVDYLKGYLDDSGRMLAAPVSWGSDQWQSLGLVAGATAGLFLVDEKVTDFFRRNQSSVGDRFASVGNALGNPLFTLPPLGALYLYGSLGEDAKARRTALLSVESMAVSGVFAQGIKLLAERHRPNTGDSSQVWDGPTLKNTNGSFPSGHTTSAFSVASVIAEEYGDNPLVPPVAYGLASLTALSRIYGDYHWASDTLVGAALGYYVGKAVTGYHAGKAGRFSVIPSYGREWQGVTVSFRF